MNKIEVISAGPGNESLLTEQAKTALAEADHIFCAERFSSPGTDPEKIRPLIPLKDALDEIGRLWESDRRIAVLVSGDAGLFSLLPLITDRFGTEDVRVLPGVSSVQQLCAGLSIPWQNARILSAHGRDLPPSVLSHTVRTNAQTLLLMDSKHDPSWARKVLDEGGLAHAKLTIGERLSYPEEHIEVYRERPYDPLSIALIENDHTEKGLPPVGLSDDEFIRGRTPMTKKEVRVQILSALKLPPDAVVWDIGAGTGSVTVECARQCPPGQVYAIEHDAEALELIRQNIRAFHLQNAFAVAGSAPEVLQDLPAPTHVFLGGTGRQTEAILKVLFDLSSPIRLCAAAVTMESAQEYFSLLGACRDFSAVQCSFSRIETVGSYHMFRAQNPVFVFSAVIGGTF